MPSAWCCHGEYIKRWFGNGNQRTRYRCCGGFGERIGWSGGLTAEQEVSVGDNAAPVITSTVPLNQHLVQRHQQCWLRCGSPKAIDVHGRRMVELHSQNGSNSAKNTVVTFNWLVHYTD